MNEIQLLCKETREELLRKLTYATEAAVESTNEDEIERWFTAMENIMYVLRNCNYKGRDN